MTPEEATQALLTAIEAEDLEALARALEARGAALQGISVLSAEAFEGGERACVMLRELQQRWAAESARLGQISSGFGHPGPPTGSRLNYRG